MSAHPNLRHLPGVDRLAGHPTLTRLPVSPAMRVEAARFAIDAARLELRAGAEPPSEGQLAEDAALYIAQATAPSLVGVVNATGVIVHTNLGRAPLTLQAVAHALGSCNLEYDLELGRRGSRRSHLESLLCALSGAQAAMVVNNNAAAVVLMLTALTGGQEVLISRGELVEIGGSFRVPEIMATSGCLLKEVGTTNRTYARDYEAAASPQTAAILRVHPSNYRIDGFVHRPAVDALAETARRHGLYLLHDLGSGTFGPLPEGVSDQGDPRRSLSAGADVVCFSGDKLLGGPQAGIILGRRDLVERMATHPLARALRADKLTIAALHHTLLAYRTGNAEAVPVVRMLHVDSRQLHGRAQRLASALAAGGLQAEVVASRDPIGGGSHPQETLAGWAVALADADQDAGELARRLRCGEPPIIGVVNEGRLHLSLRTVPPERDGTLVEAVLAASRA